MIVGRLERLLSEGYVEGWAFDSRAPERPLAIDVLAGVRGVVAEGLANLFREDLANDGRGLGWCAFRLEIARPAVELRTAALALRDKASGLPIDVASDLPWVADDDFAASSRRPATRSDGFVIETVSQLRACESLFAQFVRRRGADAFVRAAYIYLLGRFADPESLAIHGDMVSDGRLAPFRLLQMIADTREFRARPRDLAAPNAPGFPFVEAANAR